MEQKNTQRYEYLDMLRGITLVSMILYHGVWNIVYFGHVNWEWFSSTAAYVWQQSICWTFILLSGFCWSMGRRRLKRALTVLGAGALVTLATVIFTPEQRILFGVLTFLGVSMLLMIPLERLLNRIPALCGLPASIVLFAVFKNINEGGLGFGPINLLRLPEHWYEEGCFMTFLGFTGRSFFSADYFSLLPWLFLFIAGYFFYRLAQERALLELPLKLTVRGLPFAFIGKHSLLIYLLHQPVLYVGLMLLH